MWLAEKIIKEVVPKPIKIIYELWKYYKELLKLAKTCRGCIDMCRAKVLPPDWLPHIENGTCPERCTAAGMCK